MQLPTYFEKFISNIQPSDERVSKVSDAHTTLRSHLTEDAELAYPVETSFLSGSYARHTAPDPVKDADIILVLQEKSISSDKKRPSPRAILEDLKTACDDFYDKVDLQTQRRSIRIELTDDAICMDVVPAIAPDGKDKPLYVPDYEQGTWIPSHPSGHLTFATEVNQRTDGQFVRVTKGVKWWSDRNLVHSRAPKSFLLETMLAHHMKTGASNLSVAFESAIAAVLASHEPYRQLRVLPTVKDPGIKTNDLAVTTGWTVDDFCYFHDELKKLHERAVLANAATTSKARTIALWQEVFGDVYPSSLDESEEQEAARSATQIVAPPRRALRYSATLAARLCAREGEVGSERYPSNGRRLPKGYWLRFEVEKTTVPPPYSLKWIVRNNGAEARRASDMGHVAWSAGSTRWERLAYRGHHFMDLEIIKNGDVVARARHVVNIR